MRRLALASLLSACGMLITGPVHAHIKLTNPASWIQENATGDPQKSGPCGPAAGQGVETNEVTTYTAGQEITVEWTETVNHEGHFRIALAKDRAELKDPKITGQCQSAEIMDPPQLPVLADGLFAVTTDDGKRMFSQKVKLPDGFTCDKCTLQLLQFMTPHPAPCLYYHCANVKIVAAGADTGSGGSSSFAPPAAGTAGGRPIGGSSAAAGSGAGAETGAGSSAKPASAGTGAAGKSAAPGGSGAPTTGGASAASGSGASGTGLIAVDPDGAKSGGCNIARVSRSTASPGLGWLLACAALLGRRRRRHLSTRTVREAIG